MPGFPLKIALVMGLSGPPSRRPTWFLGPTWVHTQTAFGGVHIGATWRLPFIRPSAAAMRPFLSNYFDHLLIFGTASLFMLFMYVQISFGCTMMLNTILRPTW